MRITIFKRRIEEYEHELKNLHKRKCGGSVLGRLGTVVRNYEGVYIRLIEDYFVSDSKYKKEQLCHRFRMHQQLFLRIIEKVVDHDN